jgi:hypothetical protein
VVFHRVSIGVAHSLKLIALLCFFLLHCVQYFLRSDTESIHESRRKDNSEARKIACLSLSTSQQVSLRRSNSTSRRRHRQMLDETERREIRLADNASHRISRSAASASTPTSEQWWDRVAVLNRSQIAKPLDHTFNTRSKGKVLFLSLLHPAICYSHSVCSSVPSPSFLL